MSIEIGKAAEYLVLADLLLSGVCAFPTDQGLPYDIVADVSGRLVRIQVKATQRPRPTPNRPGSGNSYIFYCRKAGKNGSRTVADGTFDLLALVALDIRTIAYVPLNGNVPQTVCLRAPGHRSGHANKWRGDIDQYPFSEAVCQISN